MSHTSEARSRLSGQTLAHQVRDALVEKIASGELAAGERLLETKLSAAFGTSGAPVREALRELEGMRLVRSEPRRGTFVCDFVQQTLREAYVVRAALEETATRLAMAAGAVPFEAMAADVDTLRLAAETGDRDLACTGSVCFHRHVIEAANNDLLRRSWENLQIEARTMATILATDPDLHELVRTHSELLDALRSGEIEKACEQSRDHQWAFADLPHDARGDRRPR